MKRDHKEYWLKHLDAWRKSNLTNEEYCANHKLSPKLFSNWKSRLYKEQPDLKSNHEIEVPVFLPVDVVEPESPISASSSICIEFGQSIRIHLNPDFDERHLKRIFSVLETLQS